MGRYSGKTCRLLTMLSLTASFFIVEITVGYVANSIALVADSFHMLSDVVALVVGFASVRISKWHTQKNTFGWQRAEVLGALVNTVFLIALCFTIIVESLQRFIEIEPVKEPVLLLIVGAVGLVINLIGLALFHKHGHVHSHGGGGGGHGHSHGGNTSEHRSHLLPKAETPDTTKPQLCNGETSSIVIQVTDTGEILEGTTSDKTAHQQPSKDVRKGLGIFKNLNKKSDEHEEKVESASSQLNMRGVFLHVLGDALGSVIVIISALIIWLVDGDWKFYIDPGLSMVMVIIMLASAVPLLKETSLILLQTVPTHIQVREIQDRLVNKVDGVLAVHEFHVWRLAGDRIIASAHIRCRNLGEYMRIAEQVKEFFHDEGIHSTTIQPEFEELTEPKEGRHCALECGPDKNCYNNTCCAPNKMREEASKEGTSPTHVYTNRYSTLSDPGEPGLASVCNPCNTDTCSHHSAPALELAPPPQYDDVFMSAPSTREPSPAKEFVRPNTGLVYQATPKLSGPPLTTVTTPILEEENKARMSPGVIMRPPSSHVNKANWTRSTASTPEHDNSDTRLSVSPSYETTI